MYKSKGSGGKSMDSPVGMCSSKSNPLPMPKTVQTRTGPGSNPDMQKANKLLMQAQKKCDSLRGMSGM